MRVVGLLLAIVTAAAADEADEYFEVGLDYLRKGFFDRARLAFTESLVRAPKEPVTLVFLGVASAAEGRPASEAALFLRSGFALLRKGETLRLDLRRLLPSPRTPALLHKDAVRALQKARGKARLPLLQVMAFLEVMDGSPETAPSLDALLEAQPKGAFARSLANQQPSTSNQ